MWGDTIAVGVMIVGTPRAATRMEFANVDLCGEAYKHHRECFARVHTSGYHCEVLLRHPLVTPLIGANSYSPKVLDGVSHVELDRLSSAH